MLNLNSPIPLHGQLLEQKLPLLLTLSIYPYTI